MDSVMEKFGVVDFFNLLIAGVVFLTGSGLYDAEIDAHLAFFEKDSRFPLALTVPVALAVCYVLGLVLHEINYGIFKNRIQEKLASRCLIDESVVGNSEKFDIYIKKAAMFFQSKDPSTEYTSEQCLCYFAHCLYYIQVRGQSKKTELLRDVQSLSGVLMVTFGTLCICGIPWLLLCPSTDEMLLKRRIITLLASAVLAVVFYRKHKRDVLNRVRMILAIYDVCKDMECSGGSASIP